MASANLEQIASWIAAGEMTLTDAVISCRLSAEDKKKVKAILAGRREAAETLAEDIIEDIKRRPEFYNSVVMSGLLGLRRLPDGAVPKGHIVDRFLSCGVEFPFGRLKSELNLPDSITAERLCEDDFEIDFTSPSAVRENSFGKRCCDILFLGTGGSGMTSLAMSLCSRLCRSFGFEYDAEGDSDGAFRACCDSVMKCTEEFYQAPAMSRGDESVIVPLLLTSDKRRVAICECGGGFAAASTKHTAGDESFTRILNRPNPKILIFVVDYQTLTGGSSRNFFSRVYWIENALIHLGNNGPNPVRPGKKSTMSNVKGLALVVTKSDTEPGGPGAAREKINMTVASEMKSIGNIVNTYQDRYNMNKYLENRSFILPFTLGRFTAGNCLIYDPRTTDELAEFIINTMPEKSIFNF